MKSPVSLISLNMLICAASLVTMILLYSGCKDTGGSVTPAALQKDCEAYSAAEDWDNAIITCNKVETDTGRHFAAQAYMNRAGLVTSSLDPSTLSGDPTTLLTDALPDTEAKTEDLRAALNKMMGQIVTKDGFIYLESILVSSILIYSELTQLTSVFEAPTIRDETNDTYGIELPAYVVFGGLDPDDSTADFYQDLCGSVANTTDVTTREHDGVSLQTITITTPAANLDLTSDVTSDGCTISESSPIFYNNLANKGYEDLGNEVISGLNFYTQLNTGSNFTIDLSTIDANVTGSVSLCITGQIEPPDASDDAMNDCEILGALNDMGFSL